MDNQQPLPRFNASQIDFNKIVAQLDFSNVVAQIDFSKIVPLFDFTKAIPQIVPQIDFNKIVPLFDFAKIIPQLDFSQVVAQIDFSKILLPKTFPFPDGFFESMWVLDHSSKDPLSSFMVQGAALDEYLSTDEADLLLADGETDELRWSFREIWDSFTERQQRFIKLGYRAFLFATIVIAVFMSQTQYPQFGDFLESMVIPVGLATYVLSKVNPNLMKTRTHPINKKIGRN